MIKDYSELIKNNRMYRFNTFENCEKYSNGTAEGQRKAYECFNFRLKSGNLTDGFGVEIFKNFQNKAISLPEGLNVLKIYFFPCFNLTTKASEDKLLFFLSDGYVYKCELQGGELEKVTELNFTSTPSAVYCGNMEMDAMLFFGDSKTILYYGDSCFTVLDNPNLKTAEIYCGRLFASTDDKAKLFFSAPNDVTNFIDSVYKSGYVCLDDLQGEILKLVNYKNKLYVFRSFGITEVLANGQSSSFEVSKKFVSCGKIYGESVTLCGDRIVFLAEDGLFSFNGSVLTKIFDNDYLNALTEIESGYYNGEYYISLKYNKRNYLVAIDVSDKSYLVAEIKAKNLCEVKSDKLSALTFIYNDSVCKISGAKTFLGRPIIRKWQSQPLDFNYGGALKLLKSFKIMTRRNIVLSVESEYGKREFKISGGAGYRSVNLNLKGSSFVFTILTSESDNFISRAYAEYRINDVIRSN